MNTDFIKLSRNSPKLDLILVERSSAFLLLLWIARRANRRINSDSKLGQGEAEIGDYKTYGTSRQVYRSDIKYLTKLNLIKVRTVEGKGTIATLINSEIFDINMEENTPNLLTTSQSRLAPVTPTTPQTSEMTAPSEDAGRQESETTGLASPPLTTPSTTNKNIYKNLKVFDIKKQENCGQVDNSAIKTAGSLLAKMAMKAEETAKRNGAKYYWQDNCTTWIKKLNISKKDESIMFRLFKRYSSNPAILESWCVTAYELKPRNPIGYILTLQKLNNQKK